MNKAFSLVIAEIRVSLYFDHFIMYVIGVLIVIHITRLALLPCSMPWFSIHDLMLLILLFEILQAVST